MLKIWGTVLNISVLFLQDKTKKNLGQKFFLGFSFPLDQPIPEVANDIFNLPLACAWPREDQQFSGPQLVNYYVMRQINSYHLIDTAFVSLSLIKNLWQTSVDSQKDNTGTSSVCVLLIEHLSNKHLSLFFVQKFLFKI